MNIFISGGCKNGKSLKAQVLARDMAKEKGTVLYYIATMIPTDEEDEKRIVRHLEARDGWGFVTLEHPLNLCDLLKRDDVDSKGVFLLDSVTALLSNEMFTNDGIYHENAGDKVRQDLIDFAEHTGNTVFVSDYIYSDAADYDDITENYRKSLACCDRALAQICSRVIETGFGFFREIK